MIQLKTILILAIFLTSSLGFSQVIPEIEEVPFEGQSQTTPEGPMPRDAFSKLIGKDSLIDHVFMNPNKYHFQCKITEVYEHEEKLYFGQNHDYALDNWYFYPASLVKFPIALMSLEKLNELNFSTKATLKFDRDFECGNMKFVNESRKENRSFEEMIRKLIIVSNNTYYNSLYHFLTPERINQKLLEHRFSHSHIYKDFTGCEVPLNLKTHGFSIQEKDSTKIYTQESSRIELSEFASNYNYDVNKLYGSKSEYRGEIVDGPFDFNYNLEFSLSDIHAMSVDFFLPEYVTEQNTWNIRKEDRQMLLASMKSVPKDLGEKEYLNSKKYPDNVYKYLVHGDDNPKYDSVITYSKIGISYGFVTETAYIIDPSNKMRYIVTASIYVNENDTVNDGKYQYDEIARPFFARLGQLLLEL